MPNFLQEDYGVRQSMADTAVPASGQWNIFDMVWNSAPAVGAPLAWVCVAGGSPGTWAAVGPVDNVGTVTANSAAAAIPVTANIVSITGSGGYNLTLAVPTAAQNGTTIRFVNASSGTITLTAATGAAIIGVATMATNTSGTVISNSTNWYRI